MSITTRKGDDGSTDLLFGTRAAKSHPRIHALGAVDELNAALGPLRISAAKPKTRDILPVVQRWLIGLMGELATPPGMEERYAATHKDLISAETVRQLDEWAADLESSGALQFKGWALPGEAGVMSGAHADLARVAARRAERAIADLHGTPEHVPNPDILRFLNRLSDLLWLLARWEERAQELE
ncbi:MAG: cob(I)yrinic acid a,c-diamide adenosyltransferase [Verrucomicrobiaceae bacterium]|nr:cob(I)yrinic acid a,c-diamide adenosyltransferase [Verrucomicrobiaceae bacterium]